jgi:multidrug resistance protein, MATE family
MDISIINHTSSVAPGRLPAQRIDASGRAHVDLRAVMALAFPLIVNSAVQMVLNLTDVWFIGQISTKALAGVGAVHWLVLVTVLLFSGIGMAVQTIVAQSFGGRRFRRASQAVWIALWGTLFFIPLYALAGASGHWLLLPFGLDPEIQDIATDFWVPRIAGAPFSAALWAMFGFFNGIGRPRYTVMVSATVAVTNAVFNYIFIFHFNWGVAGSAWATNVAQALGLLFALSIFLSPPYRKKYLSHIMWRPKGRLMWQQLRLGFPMGMVPAADLLGFAIFQLMQTRLGAADGAASQTVMMITAVAYMPGSGIAMAGTTLVGQAIGAGDRVWAAKLGNFVIGLVAVLMGGIGVVLALAGPWVLPLFMGSGDSEAAMAVALGTQILWLAAAYQFFDGMHLSSGLALRGAGDAIVPAIIVLTLSWFVFVPLAHALTFDPGQGWFHFLPQLGWGALGGWVAVVVYLMLLGVTLSARWRSGAWRKVKI